jgi:ESCRT-II complex subunit VPS22
MCVPLGVDPLSTSKSFWGALLGLGEFYYELSVKVAEVCIASRSRNGGIIRYEHLLLSETKTHDYATLTADIQVLTTSLFALS